MIIQSPDGLSVISTLDGACLQVSWYPVSTAVSYNLYRSQIAWDQFSEIATVPGLTYFDIPPTPNDNLPNLWYYKVSAFDGMTESDLSSPFTYVNYSSFENRPIPGLSWSALF